MEFLTRKQKKTRARRLFTGYSLLAVLTLLLTYILVSTAIGYEIFSRHGELVQNGLLFLSSKPQNADIYINNKKENGNTNAKLSLPDGIYSIRLEKEGYYNWEHDITVRGGEVTFLTYPTLIPSTINGVVRHTFGDFSSQILPNKDNSWIISSTVSLKTWVIMNAESSTEQVSIFSIPTDIFDVDSSFAIDTFVPIEWSNDNEHVLFKGQKADQPGVVYIVCDVIGQKTCVPVTTELVGDEKIVGFWGDKSDELYTISSGGTLRHVNVRTKTKISDNVTINPVESLEWVDGDRFVYVQKITDTQARVILYTKSAERVVTTMFSSANGIKMTYGKYNRNEFLVIAAESIDKTYVYKNPYNASIADQTSLIPTVLIPFQADSVSMSEGNRLILATKNNQGYVYDLQKKELVRLDIPAIGFDDQVVVSWLGASRITIKEGQIMRIADYDGQNIQDFKTHVTSQLVLSKNGSKLHWLDTTSRVTTLNSAELIDVQLVK